MSQDVEQKLVAAIHDTRMKYVNVLLVAAAACIGFSVTQTRTDVLSVWLAPWFVSTLLWSMSFIFGCQYILKTSVLLNFNLKHTQISAGKDPMVGNYYGAIQMALEELVKGKSGMKVAARKAANLRKMQFIFFVVGSFSYITWHILEMWRRTEEYTCVLWY